MTEQTNANAGLSEAVIQGAARVFAASIRASGRAYVLNERRKIATEDTEAFLDIVKKAGE